MDVTKCYTECECKYDVSKLIRVLVLILQFVAVLSSVIYTFDVRDLKMSQFDVSQVAQPLC